jgi:hypothetical protein
VEVVHVRVGRWLVAGLVWLSAVAVVAAVAWFALDSAGREVAGADGLGLVSAVRPSPAVPPANAAPTASPPSTTLGAERPESGTGAAPTGTASVPGSEGMGAGTYSSAGGDVLVRCVGDRAAGSVIRVADGWRIGAAPTAGPLRMLFVAGDGRVAGVEAACRNGQPAFSPAR